MPSSRPSSMCWGSPRQRHGFFPPPGWGRCIRTKNGHPCRSHEGGSSRRIRETCCLLTSDLTRWMRNFVGQGRLSFQDSKVGDGGRDGRSGWTRWFWSGVKSGRGFLLLKFWVGVSAPQIFEQFSKKWRKLLEMLWLSRLHYLIEARLSGQPADPLVLLCSMQWVA